MEVSNELVVEFCSAIQHYNMNISHLIVLAQQVEMTRVKRKSRMLKGIGLLMVVLNRVRLISMTSLVSRSGSIIKLLLSSLRLVTIRFLNLQPKIKRVETHQLRILLVPSVEKVTLMNAYLEKAIFLVVVKVGSKLEIALI